METKKIEAKIKQYRQEVEQFQKQLAQAQQIMQQLPLIAAQKMGAIEELENLLKEESKPEEKKPETE